MTEEFIEELIRKYTDGTADPGEIEQLMEWYRTAPVGDVHWHSADPEERQRVYTHILKKLQKDISPARIRKMNFSWTRIAAAMIILLGVASVLIYFLKPSTVEYTTINNPAGKIQFIKLPDSSNVWLNASSSLRYANTFKENREIQLDGEAYFDVTHDMQHPFKVNAGGVQTTVLGTAFNIKAYKSDSITSVSVINGKVKVTGDSKDLAILTPSLQLQYNRQLQISETSTVDTLALIAWKMGRLQFQGQTFSQIAETLERWYNIHIVFKNTAMRSCRYYMNFNNTIPLEKLLSNMSQITDMEYQYDKHTATVTLSSNGCQ